MTNESSTAAHTTVAQREARSSANPLALGLGLLLGGAAALVLGSVLVPHAGFAVFFALAFVGIVMMVIGAVQLVVGVHRFADNVDRVARALIDARRD
ncbi:hypothetical protein ACFQHV_12950 [Promicromonospora thailandica]|uniref:Uncharacterized protein n=1 Tax=Promicromonospora thailandica TaxID=765201 RepID=A0A9X2JWW6_9MICO|nr:hypothetical protein [Promicromonospora thailandica]MCP2265982.1 hypothetical protein [Promicromonospora thailandica]BFF21435.1 hypothetical protein GCM10025730_49560 [Promicromonospora thailandica]